jgi:type IV fimbrial biogenesis protein FimT
MDVRIKAKGFTFLELIITIAIAAILMGIAIPSFQSLISSTRIYSQSRKLFNTLVMTRSHAITSGFRTILCPTIDGEQCHKGNKWHHQLIIFEDRNSDGKRNLESEPLIHTTEAAEQLNIYSGSSYASTGARRKVAYYPMGHAYGSTITITVCDKKGATEPHLIVVSNFGRPRISSRRADGSKPQCP